jgi:hypothetical protein
MDNNKMRVKGQISYQINARLGMNLRIISVFLFVQGHTPFFCITKNSIGSKTTYVCCERLFIFSFLSIWQFALFNLNNNQVDAMVLSSSLVWGVPQLETH